jgi:hypothetical protein
VGLFAKVPRESIHGNFVKSAPPSVHPSQATQRHRGQSRARPLAGARRRRQLLLQNGRCRSGRSLWGRELELEADRGSIEEARRLLGACWLFRGLGPDERKALFARVRIRIRNFAAGETVFLKGSPGDHMIAVVSGSVRISAPSVHG